MLWWWGTVLGGAGLGYAMLHLVYFADNVFGTVGFIAAPFVHGAAIAFTIARTKSSGSLGILGAVLVSSILLTWLLILTAGEGAFCIFTAAPIWLAFSVIGMFLGKAFAGTARGVPMILGVLPLALVTAYKLDTSVVEPPMHRIETVMEIHAGADAIWPLLFNLDGLGEPDTWYFRAGVACPMGTSTEAGTRLCRLTTGDMVEKITLSQENRELRWKVIHTPDAMKEMNPFHVAQPTHVAEAFRVLEGGFRLQSLPNGKTRLTGWTTYRSALAPDVYWDFWNRMIVRGVQHRMMSEIARQAHTER